MVMKLINAKELKQRLDAGESIKLICALAHASFEATRIPGSLNCLVKEDVEKLLDKEDEIVVYCSDVACNNSIRMYHLLDSLGYKKVTRFSGGLLEWESLGFPLVGSKVNH